MNAIASPAASGRFPQLAGPSVWRQAELSEDDWRVPLPAACWRELAAAMHATRGHEGPVHTLSTAGLDLDATRDFVGQVRRDRLDGGRGFVVIDRFPVEGLAKDDLIRAYWLFANVLSRPVQQTIQGRMLFDVRDEGMAAKMVPGSGIRATITNLDLNFHNDNCFNTVMPDYVSLFCLRGAREGGTSKSVSFHTLHNILAQESPELLERLYQPIWWDRHKECADTDPPFVSNPVFESPQGVPLARFSNYNIRGGYRLRDEQPDPLLDAALKRLLELFSRPDLQNRFVMQPGQIQVVNNRLIGHARDEFRDHEDPEERRHLVRLWLRDWGSVGYEG